MNVISWSESASLITFPKHTCKKSAPTSSVMYITDKTPSFSSQSVLAARRRGLSSRIVFLLSKMSPSSEGAQKPTMHEVDPLDRVKTIREAS